MIEIRTIKTKRKKERMKERINVGETRGKRERIEKVRKIKKGK